MADRRAVEDAGVAALEPVIEPGKCFNVQTLPRRGQARFTEHGDLDLRAVGQRRLCRRRRRQVQWHVLSVTPEVDLYLNLFKQQNEVAIIPQRVA